MLNEINFDVVTYLHNMLNFDHIRTGCSIELPEIAAHISNKSSIFIVRGVFPGGMGVCIHLFHPETNQEFALKGIRPDFITKQSTTDRFLYELEVWIAASSCDLIAEALAVVRLNELPCVLATWMPNGDLTKSLTQLTNKNKIEILLRIIRGLSWVKENLGVIHRDLKPSNILLDGDNLAYITDWGLARSIEIGLQEVRGKITNTVNRPDQTQQGSFLGTVTYAAPEQITGSDAIDHRADIYAIGCMMFEFETGAPPFLGTTVFDIAKQHLQKKPKKLGGLFRSTELGLANIIARCLEKDPQDRYQSYEQLESDLLVVARKHGAVLERCKPGTRYKRTGLGQGEKQQVDIIMNVPIKNRGKDGYMVVEMDYLLPFLKEAIDLMALHRYAEAEKIFHPHVLPEMLGKWTYWWGLPHDIATNYGLCLSRLGRAIEAEKIFFLLLENDFKSAAFYVNYSFILNLIGKNRQAASLCREGIKNFPNDIDIQGNLTIALMQIGEYEFAFDSALKRLEIRRDVKSLDEVADVLLEYATAIRYKDLPHAIKLIKTAGGLIKEGLHINSNYYFLHLREVFLRRLIQDAKTVNTISSGLWGSKLVPLDIRKHALIQMLEHWADNGWGSDAGANSVLQFIKNHPEWYSVMPSLKEIELRTIARYKVMRGISKDGERVLASEVTDYFLKKKSSGLLPDPILAAQLKNWLGDKKEALEIISNYLIEAPDDFNGIRLMATLQSNNGNFIEAVRLGNLLVKLAPWRSESYDCLAFVAGKAGDTNLEKQAKSKGDKVFYEESRLYEETKAYLDRA